MNQRTTTKIDFVPIPGVEGGYTALTLFPPRQFMRDVASWGVFVGGCGVARATTQEVAEAKLLNHALEYCDRQIRQAERIATHYRAQREILISGGLVPSEGVAP